MNIEFFVNMSDDEKNEELISYIQNMDIKLPHYLTLLFNIQNYAGYTFLTSASYLNDLYMIKLLVKNGADINFKDSDGSTALDYAISWDNTKTVNYLRRELDKQKKNKGKK